MISCLIGITPETKLALLLIGWKQVSLISCLIGITPELKSAAYSDWLETSIPNQLPDWYNSQTQISHLF